jgi:hypothetical protein
MDPHAAAEAMAAYPFDTSHYTKDHPCYNALNKKVLGKFKGEANSVPVTSIGLTLKMKYGGKVTMSAGCEERSIEETNYI